MAEVTIDEKTRQVDALVVERLREINETLAMLPPAKSPTIDEIVVMQFKGDGNFVYSSTKDSSINMMNLWPLIESSGGATHGEVIELTGQSGEDFDFMVVIRYQEIDYFVFGNYLGGTLEDLEANGEWLVAKSQFVALSMSIVRAIA